MFGYLLLFNLLMGIHQNSLKPIDLVVNLNKEETEQLLDLEERYEDHRVMLDFLCEHVKEFYYDPKTGDSIIVFKDE